MSINFTIANHNMMSSYQYKQPMETIWNIVKDTSLLNSILSILKQNFASEPVLLNSNTTYEKNASFFFYINKQYKLLYKVTEVIETDYYCKISCKIISSINKNQSLSKSVHLHYISPTSTYLVYERSCHLPEISKEEREKMKKDEEETSQSFLRHIEYAIENEFHLKTQIEGRRYKINVNTLIKELNSFEKDSFFGRNGFRCNRLPIIAGVCINTTCRNKLYPDKYFKLRLTVESIHCNSRGLTAKIGIINKDNADENDNGNSNNGYAVSFPNRFIMLDIIMINHEETYYSLRHYFYERVNDKVLDFVSQNKVKFLSKLHHYIDNKNKADK